jgi:glycosyltransferase involved in cell wall biosynthesis
MVDGVRFVRWGGYDQSTSIRRDLARCLLYALRAAWRVPEGDIIVTNDFWLPAVLPLMRRRAGCIVASVHRFPKGQFALYRRCSAIVPVSEAVARAIRQQTPSLSSRVAVVPNCVDAEFLARGPGARRIDERRPRRLLYVGRLHPEKGLGLLIDGLRKLRESIPTGWEALLIGPSAEAEGGGGRTYLEALKGLAESMAVQIADPIYNIGSLAQVYDQADAFVYPSVAESGEAFGLAPLEAMARGVVPVVSDLSVFREYLKPGVNGLVFDHRSEGAASSLATALTSLLQEPGRIPTMSAAARETAEGFSPAAVAEKYLDLFRALLDQDTP